MALLDSFLVWCPALGCPEEKAVVVQADTPWNAAAGWAWKHDRPLDFDEGPDVGCVLALEPVIVYVRPYGTDDPPATYTVSGELRRVYEAVRVRCA